MTSPALAEERVGLVEEQQRAALFGRVENLLQVLFGLADVLADHRRKVDAVEIEAQLASQHFGGERLAGAAGAGEQRAQSETALTLVGKSPALVNLQPLLHLRGEMPQDELLQFRQDQIVPGGARHDTLGKVLEARTGERAAGAP